MTKEQLENANALNRMAQATANLKKDFNADTMYKVIFFPKGKTGVDPTELKLHGTTLCKFENRPEVFAAVQAAIILMRSAIEAEAIRHAKEFDSLEFNE